MRSIITIIVAAVAMGLEGCAGTKDSVQPSKQPASEPKAAESPQQQWRSESEATPWRTVQPDRRAARLATALQNVEREGREAGSKGLETFGKLVNEQNASAMGFGSTREVQSATVGEGIPVVTLGLDELKRFNPDSDVFGVMGPIRRALVTVMVDGKVRSSIIVEPTKEGSKAIGFGGPEVIRALAAEGQKHNREGVTHFAVQAPALNSLFFAELNGNEVRLTPVFDDPVLGLRSGATALAKEVIALLAAAAKKHDGMPR